MGAETPRVSVVMTVRNLAPHLRECVESILSQSYGNFEFVIRDDGSTDGGTAILRSFAESDRRIRLFVGEKSLGPAGSSNWVTARAKGELIARMDGDDWSHPSRLLRQVALLEAEPDAVLVGTLAEIIDERGRLVRGPEPWRLVSNSPFAPFPHGSIMYRRKAFEAVGGYSAKADFWEDLELYRRVARHGTLLVIPEPLYRHRATRLSTRLVSDRVKVEASVNRMYTSVAPATREARKGKVAPRVFLSLGSTELWSGARPAILIPVLRRADLRLDLTSAMTLVWAIWAASTPSTLRLFLRSVSSLRNLAASRRVGKLGPHAWHPREPEAPATR